MTIFMAAFAVLISTMFLGTIIMSLQESASEAREFEDDRRHRIF